MLELKNVSKKLGFQVILEEVDFKIDQGELIHIVGANGCGKSTLFKLFCDILEPDKGEVVVDSDVRIGALIENPAFMEESSLKTNLKFLASINKNYNESKIRELVNNFDLDFDSKVHVKKYSVGMRQKMGIIQAVMEDQNLILLDEPTRGLDKKSLEQFHQLVQQLHEEGKSIVIAAHDNLAELQFDKEYLMEEGKLILQ